MAAWFGMNDIASAKASFSEQAVIFKRKHNWIMCWLYLGTFGSFIGYSAGLPLLIKSQFPGVDPMQYAFLGPLVGALARPVGGWLADKLGGARVTFWNFVVMAAAAGGVLSSSPVAAQGRQLRRLPRPCSCCSSLTTGIGNGSTFRMIPVIFLTFHERLAPGPGAGGAGAGAKDAAKEAAAVIGFSSAIAAYGAFFIPRTFGISMKATGSPAGAFIGFIVVYVTCIALTWWFYARRAPRCPASRRGRAMERSETWKRNAVLAMNTFGFTVMFAVWVVFAIIGIAIRKELGLGETEFAVLVALPILTGSLLRLPIGMATDWIGGRPIFTALLASSAIPLLLLSQATQYWQYLVLGLFIGLSGTPSRWGSPTPRPGSPSGCRGRRSASSGPATPAPRSPSSSPRG